MTAIPDSPSNDRDFEVTLLNDLVDSDPAMFKKFALMFIASFETALANIDTALATSDLAAMGAMGHRAKSTARNIGALALGRECELLETLSANATIEEAALVAIGLRPMFDTIRCTLLSVWSDPPPNGL